MRRCAQSASNTRHTPAGNSKFPWTSMANTFLKWRELLRLLRHSKCGEIMLTLLGLQGSDVRRVCSIRMPVRRNPMKVLAGICKRARAGSDARDDPACQMSTRHRRWGHGLPITLRCCANLAVEGKMLPPFIGSRC